MVEGARLESVYACKGIEGSNPSLSAEIVLKAFKSNDFEGFFVLVHIKINQIGANERERLGYCFV